MSRPSKALVLVAAMGGILSKGCASRGSEPHGTGGGGASPTAGASGSGGAPSSGGISGTGGSTNAGGRGEGGATDTGGQGSGGASTGEGGASTGTGGRGSGGAAIGTGGRGTGGASTGVGGALGKFSFFVTSLEAMRHLSGSADGFGGDLRFGEATGLAGADKICSTIAETSMPGSSAKGWRAFLSIAGPPGVSPISPVVNAIDRVGEGPWYDRMGRLLAATKADLVQVRPRGGDPAIIDDLPNENGIQNHNPDGLGQVDNHDVMTGTGSDGKLDAQAFQKPSLTCDDWTSSEKKRIEGDFNSDGSGPKCGHSWAGNWMGILVEGGCGAGVNLVETGPPRPGVFTVGTGGGYGAIYCFALQP